MSKLNSITLNFPETCPNCGSHNWKISGSLIHEKIDVNQITISCMRCRNTIHCKTDEDSILAFEPEITEAIN